MEQTLDITASPVVVEIEVGGINYKLDTETKEATVIRKSGGWYSGEIVIPAEVEHEGAAYRVVQIGKDAFMDCNGLISVDIPEGVTEIEGWAFCKCHELTSVTIGGSVTIIGKYAFSGCSALNFVAIPGSEQIIGEAAFSGCSALESVTIGEGGACIKEWAFAYCTALKEVTFLEGVKAISPYTCYGCSSLKSVKLPSSVTEIGQRAFAYCPKLLDVYCLAEDAPFAYGNSFEGLDIERTTLHVPDASIGSYMTTSPWSRFDWCLIDKLRAWWRKKKQK